MRTILINRQEIEAAIRNPHSGKIMIVTHAWRILQVDRIARGKKNTLLLHCQNGWTSDFITIYKEV